MQRIYSYKLHNRFLNLIHNYTKPDIFMNFRLGINIFNVFNKIHGETVLTTVKILKKPLKLLLLIITTIQIN
jgi:hypothetical protein